MGRLYHAMGMVAFIAACGNLNTVSHKKSAASNPVNLNADPGSQVNAIPGEKVARTDNLGTAGLNQNCCGRDEYTFNALSGYCEYLGMIVCNTPTPNRCAYKAPQACFDNLKASKANQAACQQALDKRYQVMSLFYDNTPCNADADCSLYTESFASCPQVKAISKLTFGTLAAREEAALSAEVMRTCLGSDKSCAGDAGLKPVCDSGRCAAVRRP